MRCNRIIANTFRKHLSQFNVTDSQLSILFIISKIERLNQKKISDILILEKSSVHRNLNRLLQNGLINYKEGTTLSLTKKGKDKLETIIPHWQNAMNEIKIVLSVEGENSLNELHTKLLQIK